MTDELPIVTGERGLRGRIENPEDLNRQEGNVAIRFDHGQTAYVPAGMIEKKADGSYFIPLTIDQLKTGTPRTEKLVVIPVIAEDLTISKREKLRGKVRVTKQVRAEERVVDLPTITEEVEVRRIPRDHLIDQPAEVRREGDTIIIPVMEEVLVVEKRYRLKEEVYITKQRRETHRAEQHMLRKEKVLTERIEGREIERE